MQETRELEGAKGRGRVRHGTGEVTEETLHTDEISATLFSLPFLADSKDHCSQKGLLIIPIHTGIINSGLRESVSPKYDMKANGDSYGRAVV